MAYTPADGGIANPGRLSDTEYLIIEEQLSDGDWLNFALVCRHSYCLTHEKRLKDAVMREITSVLGTKRHKWLNATKRPIMRSIINDAGPFLGHLLDLVDLNTLPFKIQPNKSRSTVTGTMAHYFIASAAYNTGDFTDAVEYDPRLRNYALKSRPNALSVFLRHPHTTWAQDEVRSSRGKCLVGQVIMYKELDSVESVKILVRIRGSLDLNKAFLLTPSNQRKVEGLIAFGKENPSLAGFVPGTERHALWELVGLNSTDSSKCADGVVQALIKSGYYDLNFVPSGKRDTVLEIAAKFGNIATIKALVESGADGAGYDGIISSDNRDIASIGPSVRQKPLSRLLDHTGPTNPHAAWSATWRFKDAQTRPRPMDSTDGQAHDGITCQHCKDAGFHCFTREIQVYLRGLLAGTKALLTTENAKKFVNAEGCNHIFTLFLDLVDDVMSVHCDKVWMYTLSGDFEMFYCSARSALRNLRLLRNNAVIQARTLSNDASMKRALEILGQICDELVDGGATVGPKFSMDVGKKTGLARLKEFVRRRRQAKVGQPGLTL